MGKIPTSNAADKVRIIPYIELYMPKLMKYPKLLFFLSLGRGGREISETLFFFSVERFIRLGATLMPLCANMAMCGRPIEREDDLIYYICVVSVATL